jgi:hypothetical protein
MRSDFVTKAPPASNVLGGNTNTQPFLLLTPQTSPSPIPATNIIAQPCFLAVPGTKRWEQRKFGVRAAGFVTVGADSQVAFSIYGGIDPNPNNNILLATTGGIAVTQASGGVPWYVELDGIFDSIAGRLCGLQRGMIGMSPVAAAPIANQLTNLNSNTEPVFQMSMFVTFGVANAASYATLQDFGIEG